MKKRHALFVASYAEHHNAEKAAIEAGYSERSARTQAYRLIRNVEISKAIDKKIAQKVEKIEAEGTKRDECREALQSVLPEVVAGMIQIARDEMLDASVRLRAMEAIADRAGLVKQVQNEGPQTIIVTGGLPLDPTQ